MSDISADGDPGEKGDVLVEEARESLPDAEVLFRQVHPDLMHGEEPASSAFVPKASDRGFLSVDRSSITTAAESHRVYVANGLRSAATYGVTVGGCGKHNLSCCPDPLVNVPGKIDNLAHALVDFTGLSTGQRKRAGQRLKAAAMSRGVLHRA